MVVLLPSLGGSSPAAAHPSAWGRSTPHPGAIVPDEPVTTTTSTRLDEDLEPSSPGFGGELFRAWGRVLLYAVAFLAVVGVVAMALLGLALGAIHAARRLVAGRR